MKRSRIALFLLILLGSCSLLPQADIVEMDEGIPPIEETSIDLTEQNPEPQPTQTVQMTVTPAGSIQLPFPVSTVLQDTHILSVDTFDRVQNNWYQGAGYLDIEDGAGVFTVTSEGFGYLFPGSAEGDYAVYGEGSGLFFRFKLPAENLYRLIFSFQSGSDDAEDYTERGVAFEYNHLNHSYLSYLVGWAGRGNGLSNQIPNQRLEGNLSVLPERWYSMMLGINQNGELLVKIWDEGEPGRRLIKQVYLTDDAQNRPYTFSIFTMGSNSILQLDDFVEFSFSPGEVLLSAVDYDLPEPVRETFSGVRTRTLVDFESHPNWFAQSGFFSVKNGSGKLEINPGSKSYSAFLVPGPPMKPLLLEPGKAVLLKYMINYQVDASFTISSGDWHSPDYREFGLMTGYNEQQGRQVLETNCWYAAELLPACQIGDDSIFVFEADRWYFLLLAVGEENTFLIRVWDVEQPQKVRSLYKQMDAEWGGRSWQYNISFLTEGSSNAIYLDDYIELSFDEILLEPMP